MGHLTLEAKERIVRKALNRGDTTLITIARENNVGYSTLQRWVKNFAAGTLGSSSIKALNKSEKLHHIIATANLNEVSLGEYCRKHGFYSHELKGWQAEMIKPTDSNKKNENKSDLKRLKLENDRLKKELKRKEKALAEASALLILKKKQT